MAKQDQQTIESRVAAAILEKPMAEIEIDGEVYKVAPPSIGTLILVSEIVSTLPVVEKVNAEKMVYSVLYNARFFRPLGDMAAVLILGAKNLKEKRERVMEKRYLFGLIRRRKTITEEIDKRKMLAQQIIDNVRPSVLFNLVIRRLEDMEISSFFGITTSLSEANLLKPTKEVED